MSVDAWSTAWYLVGSSQSQAVEVQGDKIPVDRIAQNLVGIVGSRVAIVDIISVLPDIEDEEGRRTMRDRGVGIVIGGYLELAVLEVERGPSAAEMTDGLSLERVDQPVRRMVYDRLPRVKITDLLLEVDGWTGFSECFTHRRSGRPAEDRNALLTVILADGINLGLTRMADKRDSPAVDRGRYSQGAFGHRDR